MPADRQLKIRCWVWVPGPVYSRAREVCAEGNAWRESPSCCEHSSAFHRLSACYFVRLHRQNLKSTRVTLVSPVVPVCLEQFPASGKTCLLNACFLEEFSER